MASIKRERNIQYLLSLKIDNLLLPYRFEAGIYNLTSKKTDFHWGWDSPLSQIRGTFTGHWLSAAAKIYRNTNNLQIKAMADEIVKEIQICQRENGGRWAFPIPEKYLSWLKNGKRVWAPQYVCHKVMMGLLDMYLYAGNEVALNIVRNCADWFYDFARDIDRETMSDMMDLEETGGMMELWADLYSITKEPKHLELMIRYERPRLFEPILNHMDVLTNVHANITIPEIHGAARAYEVTGEERYRQIAENYWELAVEERGSFVTGGQTSGEIWTPIKKQSARLGSRNQEHCVVYNMMRLSQYLYRWTGDKKYADYWEQNLYNGIFAQGYWEENRDFLMNEDLPPQKGLITYYLPLEAGGQKKWGSETNHFWCCHGTLVQANSNFHESIYYVADHTIYIAQYIPSKLEIEVEGAAVRVIQEKDPQAGSLIKICETDIHTSERPNCWAVKFIIDSNGKLIQLKFRNPWWIDGNASLFMNNKKVNYNVGDGYITIEGVFSDDIIQLILPKKISCWPLPDRKDTVAFIDGPVALAAIDNEQRTILGDINDPTSFIIPDNEREWINWLPYYRTINQPVNFRFVPLYEIGYEKYNTYFQVSNQKA